MKIFRRQLRRLIESVINEEENPGSKFASSVKKGAQNKSAEKTQKATQELQKTYDWFVEVVFPAIENNMWPIVADDDYHTMKYSMFAADPRDRVRGMIPKGTKFSSLQDAPLTSTSLGMTLSDFYTTLEESVIYEKLKVTMQSDQPDEFEAEVKKAEKDKGSRKNLTGTVPDISRRMDESLSHRSMYRQRYRRY